MAFRIYDPVFLHEIGKRKNNEDMVYPFDDSATTADRLFLVCDGVGGANKGEVASLMICELFQVYFQENDLQHVSKSDLDAYHPAIFKVFNTFDTLVYQYWYDHMP